MYISNSSNIGMATLLQNNKNCMKTLRNGTSVVGTAGTNHIIVGNVVNAQSVGQQHQQQQLQTNHHQVGLVNSTNVQTQPIVTSTHGGLSGSNNMNTLGGNLVLPPQTQTILLTNSTAGTSTILTYQQYQQLLQQQQQQQQQRLLVSQNLVNVPIGNLVSTSNGGLAVITDSASNHNASISGSTTTSQGTFMITSTSAASTSPTNSFQQQFQQQLSNIQNITNSSSSTTTNTTPTIHSTYLKQSSNQQQQKRLIATTSAVATTSSVGNISSSNTATIRHFSQFSQQQQKPANTINVITNTSTPNSSNNNANNQLQQRTTTVLINRNNNTIIAGNTTQRLQHATILTKTPANLIKTTQHHSQQQQPTLVVNNMAVQQVINSSNGQIISLLKTTQAQQQQQQKQINKNFITKTKQTTTANLPLQQQLQQKQQRYSNKTIQQIKQQQIKVVTATSGNQQTIPQRATIINPNTITKNNVVLSNSNNNRNNSTKLFNLPKTTTNPVAITSKNISSNIQHFSTQTQQEQQQEQQMNGHLNKVSNLQHQPASKLVPNGHNNIINISSSYNTNNSFINSPTDCILSSSSNPVSTAFSSIYNTATTSITTNPNTSYIHTTLTNSQHQYSTTSTSTLVNDAVATNTATDYSNLDLPTTTVHLPSNSPPIAKDSNNVSMDTTSINVLTPLSAETIANTATTATTTTSAVVAPTASEQQESEPEIDIVINNVVCSFSVRCHLNLREIALNGANVEYRRENGMVTMKLRRPYTTASIWSSGRITCTGATSEEQAKIAARRYARCLEKLGFRVRFNNFRVVNVLGTCSMPWAIKIVNFSEKYREAACYEPELHPGVTYKLHSPKATLKIFSTGSITVTAGSVANVQAAIEHIFPLVYEFRKKRSPEELEQLRLKQQQNAACEDIIGVEDAMAGTILGTVSASSLQRRTPNTLNKFPNSKQKHFNDIDKEFDVDDPDCIAAVDEDDIVMYDPNESIIEGPDDEDDDL